MAGTRFVDLSPADRQAANQGWWLDNPMTYRADDDEVGTTGWFEEVDRRFLSTTYYAEADGRPFGRFLTPDFAEGREVLEIGCGMGTHASLLIGEGAKYTGIDLTETAVEMTTRRLDAFGLEGTVMQADAESLPFEDASFDSVWTWGVIHHSSSFGSCWDEVKRVLRPGGRLMMMVYHHPSLYYYLYCGLGRGILQGRLLRGESLEDIYLDQMDGAYARRFTRRELRQLTQDDFRFVTIDVVGQKEELYPIPRSRVKRALVDRTPDSAASWILSRLGHMVVVQAERQDPA